MTGWGIVGPGGIAGRFAGDVGAVDGCRLVAVASRSLDRAQAFARDHDIPNAYGDVEQLLEHSAVEVVYIATPHAQHAEVAIAALRAGKHVLCEKPMALTVAQTEAMVAVARAEQSFLMEAMWARFLPSYRTLVDIVGSGRIGDVVLVEGDLGMQFPYNPAHRLFDPALGGGATLDLGIYPVQLCSLLLGPPDRVLAGGTLAATGVDDLAAAVLHHASGAIGVVKSASQARLSCTARVTGTLGSVDLPAPMHCPFHLDVTTPAGTERIDTRHEGDGIRFQVVEVQRCLGEGLLESPLMPLEETLTIAATLDDICAQLGVVYSA